MVTHRPCIAMGWLTFIQEGTGLCRRHGPAIKPCGDTPLGGSPCLALTSRGSRLPPATPVPWVEKPRSTSKINGPSEFLLPETHCAGPLSLPAVLSQSFFPPLVLGGDPPVRFGFFSPCLTFIRRVCLGDPWAMAFEKRGLQPVSSAV